MLQTRNVAVAIGFLVGCRLLSFGSYTPEQIIKMISPVGIYWSTTELEIECTSWRKRRSANAAVILDNDDDDDVTSSIGILMSHILDHSQ